MSDDHVGLPPKSQRSVITRQGKHHQTNCAGFAGSKWKVNAHHILPVTCFNPIDVNPPDKAGYVLRCVQVSKWDINAGNRFKITGDENNNVALPLYSAYFNSYPKKANGPFQRVNYPVNQCMHNSRYSEHHLYIREVKKHLQSAIWSTLQEDKVKHKLKGKPILSELKTATKHFRDQLVLRGARTTPNNNAGTIACWNNKATDDKWMLPFSMASDGDTMHPI